MAETPDLGAAETAFTEAETTFKRVETEYISAQDAWKADENNEALKSAFTEHETKYNQSKATYDSAKTALDDLKAAANKGYWPENWRDQYVEKQVGKDGKPLADADKTKLLKRLARYTSPQAALDALISAQDKIASGKLASKLPENPTEEELKQWRKDNNVPEDSKSYNLTLGEGLVVGEDDKAIVEGFLEHAHKSNMPQNHVTDVLNWYYSNEDKIIAQRHEADATYLQESTDELRNEWGTEFRSNVNLISNFFADAPEGLYEQIRTARAADGTPLGSMPNLMRFFAGKARELNPAGALVPGTGTKQMDSLIDEIETLEKRMGSDENWHKDTRAHERYQALIAARDNLKTK